MMAFMKKAKLLNALALCTISDAANPSNLRKQSTRITKNESACADGSTPWKLALTVDSYAWETKWSLKNSWGGKLGYGPPDDTKYERNGDYEYSGCLLPDSYTFVVKDQSGDGLCCKYGDGMFELTVGDEVVAVSDDQPFKKLEFSFFVTPQTNEPDTSKPTSKPTDEPTKRPSPSSSNNPSLAPSPSPSLRPTPSPTKPPTQAPSPSLSTEPPSKKPTPMPITPWPTYAPSESPAGSPSNVMITSPKDEQKEEKEDEPENETDKESDKEPEDESDEDETEDPTKTPSWSPTFTPTSTPSFNPTGSSSGAVTEVSPGSSSPTKSPNQPTDMLTSSKGELKEEPEDKMDKGQDVESRDEPDEEPTKTPSWSPTFTPTTAPFFNPTGSPPSSSSPTESPSETVTETSKQIDMESASVNSNEVSSAVELDASQSEETGESTQFVDFVSANVNSEASSATEPEDDPPTFTPTKTPTFSPTASPTIAESEVPSRSDSEAPSISSSESPSFVESEMPSVALSQEPSVAQSEEPSLAHSEQPSIVKSVTPSTTQSEVQYESPSQQPSIAISEEPNLNQSEFLSVTNETVPTSFPSAPPTTPRLIVSFTPFVLYLITKESGIDMDELDSILSDHLLEQMQSNLPKSTAVSNVELLTASAIVKRSLEDVEDDAPQNEVSATTTHKITVSGDAFFAGSVLPTTEQLDDINAAAFAGDAGNDFIQDLLSADDTGLQSTVGMSLPIDYSDEEFHKDFIYNELLEPPTTDNAFNTLYVVAALFVVGLLLVAIFVHRTRQGRRRSRGNVDDFIEKQEEKKDDTDLPKFIDILGTNQAEKDKGENKQNLYKQDNEQCDHSCCFFNGLNEVPSNASTEIASNKHTAMTNYGNGSLEGTQTSSKLYQIHENEEHDHNFGLFCGADEQTVTVKRGEDRFGEESQWGLKPATSEDTHAMQRCGTRCN